MITEKRFIDANVLLKKTIDIYQRHCNNSESILIHAFFLAILIEIKNAFTVDVIEVVHGRWVDEYNGKYANPRYRCSICKENALYKFELDDLHNYQEVQALTPNCPYCGAKMSEGE